MRILVTGGTGSFGHAATDRLLKRKDVKEIVVFSRDEEKQHHMRLEYRNNPKITFVVGDVRDRDAVRHVMRGIDVIFHAAALKQVPTGEFFPWEIVKTNILGTHNVADMAEEAGVRKMVLLSTDKSVQPINAMGMSKALAEKTITAYAHIAKKTIFCAVRYGNVAASRGSVIPVFVEAIKQGKPLTLTVAHMTRFMLSLEDAVDLVELAVDKGGQGDIFIKKSPAATVGDLAKALLEVFDSKVKTEVVGIREGEKIHEVLAHALELLRAEDLGTHFRIRTSLKYDYKSYFEESEGKEPKSEKNYTSETTERLSVPQIKKFLLTLPYIQKELKEYRQGS
jgi:UDP-N-acetylglucosamine 4,6-dehydratase